MHSIKSDSFLHGLLQSMWHPRDYDTPGDTPKLVLYINVRQETTKAKYITALHQLDTAERLLGDILPGLLLDFLPVTRVSTSRRSIIRRRLTRIPVCRSYETISACFRKHERGKTDLNIVYASLCAGSFTFGSSNRSWIPNKICRKKGMS